MISAADVDAMAVRCAEVPRTTAEYVAKDYVAALLVTVLDFRMNTVAVRCAEKHFKDRRWDVVRTLGDLQSVLASWPDDKAGNTQLAQYLWGYNHWSRAHMLRGLVKFFDSQGLDSLPALREWAVGSDYKRDFEGRVQGLGAAVYRWLVMRLGVETVRPDVHLRRFVESTLGRKVSDDDIVAVISGAASRLNMRTLELDWSVCEYQRSQ